MARSRTGGDVRRDLTSPAAFVYLHKQQGWSIGWSIAGAIFLVAAFRGFIDLILRRFLPWPSLFGTRTHDFAKRTS